MIKKIYAWLTEGWSARSRIEKILMWSSILLSFVMYPLVIQRIIELIKGTI